MHGRGAGDDRSIVIQGTSSPRQPGVRLLENMVFICKALRDYRRSCIPSHLGRYLRRYRERRAPLGKRAHDLVVT